MLEHDGNGKRALIRRCVPRSSRCGPVDGSQYRGRAGATLRHAMQTERAEVPINGEANLHLQPVTKREAGAIRKAERLVRPGGENRPGCILVSRRYPLHTRKSANAQRFAELSRYIPAKPEPNQRQRLVQDVVARQQAAAMFTQCLRNCGVIGVLTIGERIPHTGIDENGAHSVLRYR